MNLILLFLSCLLLKHLLLHQTDLPVQKHHVNREEEGEEHEEEVDDESDTSRKVNDKSVHEALRVNAGLQASIDVQNHFGDVRVKLLCRVVDYLEGLD